jgi:glycosyltransferase involved in cell wall biosynthesis
MLSGDAKWGAFHMADAFVLSSHQENFGVVVAEALGCGKPVLISDKVNIWREVAAANAGLVEPDTSDGATSLLRGWLALDQAKRAEMAKNAVSLFKTSFDISKVGPALIERVCREIGR